MSGLTIGKGISLPTEAATRRLAILGTSGAGKSNAAVVMAEEFYAAKVPWFAIDPKGDWWGVRSSGDGKKPGLHVPIFGGIHGDIPIEATAGKVLAETIARQRLTALIDVSQFESRQEMFGFLADFASTMLRMNTEPMHAFLDECHQYIPQRALDKGTLLRCLGAFERLVGQGRNKGIGVSLLSQRSALVNKNVLDLTECMIAMRTFSPRDRDAVEGWLSQFGGSKEISATISALENGEAWIYAPEWLRKPPERIQFRQRWTFDSGATPKVGESVTPPSTLADVDLAALGGRIAETVERVKADDPKALRARIAELERAARDVKPTVDTEAIEGMRLQRDAAMEVVRQVKAALASTAETLRTLAADIDGDALAPAHAAPRPDTTRHPVAAPRVAPSRAPATTADSDAKPLAKVERAVLSVLAQYGSRTKRQVATLTGYAIGGGGFLNGLGSLRSRGYVVGTDPLEITDAGVAAIDGQWEELPTGRALVEWWQSKLSKAERAILGALVDCYPEALTKADVAERTGYEAKGGGFGNACGRLRTLELIEGTAEMRASEAFFVPAV